jgi:hypothetical protein
MVDSEQAALINSERDFVYPDSDNEESDLT